ncbi:MAG: hypothetical protein P4L59_18785 [Desulfosporosinus sp.]|nr:hypothetical protein [Desulfosporosinus sp.]
MGPLEIIKALGEVVEEAKDATWMHVNFLGEYTFDVRNVPELDDLRPLDLGNREN